MNRALSKIRFNKYTLIMTPSFIDNTEKIDELEVCIYLGQTKIDNFTLCDSIHDIVIPQMGQTNDIIGKIYFDVSRERIIIEGTYSSTNKSSTFWFEIDPNASYLKTEKDSKLEHDISLNCEDYPLSVGSVVFDVASTNTSKQNIAKPQVIAQLKSLNQDIYLNTILSENNKEIRGINTCIDDNSGFVGDIGIYRNKIYIDGEMMENGSINCFIYAELGEQFLD